MCSQLMDCARGLEDQLVELRAQHASLRTEAQALRTCLDRAGVLSAVELEQELSRAKANANTAEGAMFVTSGTAASSTPIATSYKNTARGLRAGVVTPARGAHTMRTRAAAATPANGASAPRAVSPHAAARSPSAPRRSLSRTAPAVRSGTSQSPDRPARVATTASASPRAAASRDVSRRHSLSESSQNPSAVQSAQVYADHGTWQQLPDLYQVARPMFDQHSSAAEQQGAFRVFQQVLQHMKEPPDSWSGPGTPLGAAAKAHRSDVGRVLLRARADPNACDSKGVSPLHITVFDGSYEFCKLLLGAKANVNICDRHGQTPLFFAPTTEICKLLVAQRADITKLNRRGQSALHLAARAGLYEILDWLGSRVSKALLDLRDAHGATARSYADGYQADAGRGPLAAVAEHVEERDIGHGAVSRRGGGSKRGVLAGGGASSSAATAATARQTSGAASGADGWGAPAVGSARRERSPTAEYSIHEQVKSFNMADADGQESFTLDDPGGDFTDTGTSAGGRSGPALEEMYDSGSWARAHGEATMLEAAAAVASAAVATVAELNQSAAAPDEDGSIVSGNSSDVGEGNLAASDAENPPLDAHVDRESYWDDLGEEVF